VIEHGPEREALVLAYVDVLEECFAYALAAMAATDKPMHDAHMGALRDAMAKGMPAMDRAVSAGVRFNKQPHLDQLGNELPGHLARILPGLPTKQ
jgi:hypothetical protein